MKHISSKDIVGHASRIRERVFFSRANTSSLNTGKLVLQSVTRKLSLPILLAICLLPAINSDATPPDHPFEQALQIRDERPDEAVLLFTEAAFEFEDEQQFFNAGNSWFFAGENGRALANYLAAESRRPFNKEIRESIAFIRTQRVDKFQCLEKPTTKVSKVWKRFCRHSPVLRFGIVTLMYLIGWGAFLTARFLGKTIRRKGWIIYCALAFVIALSLVRSAFQPQNGVVIQTTDARLGPGHAYNEAFDAPLHEATEFQWLDTHDDWIRARLPDGSNAWLRETACELVR